MKTLLTFTLATAASVALLAQPVTAQDDNIVVTPGMSQAAFVDKVSQDLDRQLVRSDHFNEPIRDGIAIVRFTRGDDGQPENISLYRKTGRYGLDRLAKKAVSHLSSLDAVPSGVESGQLYQANIIFASDEVGARRLQKQLMAEETARMASGQGKPAVIAVGHVVSRPSS